MAAVNQKAESSRREIIWLPETDTDPNTVLENAGHPPFSRLLTIMADFGDWNCSTGGRTGKISGQDDMHPILESVKVDLDEDEIRRLIDAVDHYEAYLHSQQRDDAKFRELLVRLRKMLGKRSSGGS